MPKEITGFEREKSVEKASTSSNRERLKTALEYIGIENEKIQKQLYAVDEKKVMPAAELLEICKENPNDYRFKEVARILNGDDNVKELWIALDRVVMHVVEHRIKMRPDDYEVSDVEEKDRVNFTDAKQGFFDARQILQGVAEPEEPENIPQDYWLRASWMIKQRLWEAKNALEKSIQDTRTPSPSPSALETLPQGDIHPSSPSEPLNSPALESSPPPPQGDIHPSTQSQPLDSFMPESGKQQRPRRAAAKKATEETARMYTENPPKKYKRTKKRPKASTSDHVSPPPQEDVKLDKKQQRRPAAEESSRKTQKNVSRD